MEAHNQSWAEMLDSSNSGDGMKLGVPDITIEDCDPNDTRNNSSHEILEIEFNDSENEKKFDKLVTEKKIKSPFKRRLSNEKIAESNATNVNQTDKKMKSEEEQVTRKRFRTDSSESSSTGSSFQNREIETDQGILERRQKQIDYGKNTEGYDNYVSKVPKDKRTRDHPKTPPKHLKYSRRAWEGLIKSWRKKLHAFDSKCGGQNTDSTQNSDKE